MALPKISTRSTHGFTLTEILIVIGLISVVASMTVIVSMDSWRGSSFSNERNAIVSALQRARGRAMSNMCLGPSCTAGKMHGVHISSGSYTVFQGNIYTVSDPINEVGNIGPTIAVTGNTDIVFSQLSGDASPTGTITVKDNAGRSSIITIGARGQISWTN
jgi:prepilin-type N-terminal cleavage/methylation domain-containing protein